jgi:hypothetical protein
VGKTGTGGGNKQPGDGPPQNTHHGQLCKKALVQLIILVLRALKAPSVRDPTYGGPLTSVHLSAHAKRPAPFQRLQTFGERVRRTSETCSRSCRRQRDIWRVAFLPPRKTSTTLSPMYALLLLPQTGLIIFVERRVRILCRIGMRAWAFANSVDRRRGLATSSIVFVPHVQTAES